MLELYFLKELSVVKEQLLGIKRLFREEVKAKARCSYMEGWSRQAGVWVAQAVCLSGRKRSAQVSLSASLCEVSPGGAQGSQRTAGLLASPASWWAQRMEVTGEGGQLDSLPRALSDSQNNLYPLPGVM